MDPKYRVTVIASAATVLMGILLIVFRAQLTQIFDLRTICIMAGGLVVLAGANVSILRRSANPIPVRFIVAFNSVIFIVIGVTAGVLICHNWETTILLAGSCLLIGGFVGLLFGYPQGVAQKHDMASVPPPPGAAAPVAPPVVPHAQNLVADSAATLGKVITGFTLAKLTDATHYFEGLIRFIAPALGCPDASTAPVVAGVLMAYFLATGFLSGLFLPSYFMTDVI